MRNEFANALLQYAKFDSDITLIIGDVGFSVWEVFQKNYPERFINAGIGEQNMMSLAAGMALTGKKPYVYSITNFATMRCLEQIRNDVCYHNTNVKIVSVGSGFSYGTQGYTHHGIEDITVMRVLPNMQVYNPADVSETLWLTKHMQNCSSPAYMRLAKAENIQLHKNLGELSVPQMIPIITGFKNTVLSSGTITTKIYKKLKEERMNFNLYSVPVIKPLDINALISISMQSHKLVTVEEHQLMGGFGAAVLEALNTLYNEQKIDCMPVVHRLGINDLILKDMTSAVFSEQLLEKLLSISATII